MSKLTKLENEAKTLKEELEVSLVLNCRYLLELK